MTEAGRTIEPGAQAPDFELVDQHGQPVRLSAFEGRKRVVLVFFPLAFSPVCDGELCTVRDRPDGLVDQRTELLAISVDSPLVHKAWAEQRGFDFRLLADFWPHGAVADRYGVFDEQAGVARRATFVIDLDRVVRWSEVGPMPEVRDQDRWRDRLAEVG